MREHKLLPWVIDALTLSEITVWLEKPEDRKVVQSREELQAAVREFWSMGPRERLLRKRRQMG